MDVDLRVIERTRSVLLRVSEIRGASDPSTAKAPLEWHVIRKREEILGLQPELTALARRCGQPGMMEALEYFLSLPYLDLRFPHKFLDNVSYLSEMVSKVRTKLPRLLVQQGAGGLTAAALLFEHHLFGVPTGIYMPVNGEVYRTVVAPEERVAAVAREVGEHLMERGGLIAMVSYLEESAAGAGQTAAWEAGLRDAGLGAFWEAEHLIATGRRDSSCRLALEKTFDGTLATMGAHTRRNLRAFQRRAVKELGATYEAQAEVSFEDFLELNAASKYSVTRWMAQWRYGATQTVAGGRISGLRGRDGRWLSLMGSRAQEGTVWLDWQMNREMGGTISLISAMRAFFIATQIGQGMRWIHFEGGTPHSMSSAFVQETARDLLFARKALTPTMLKRIAGGISSTGPLAMFLGAGSQVWRSRVVGPG